jgi:VWFA-related protein
MPRTPLVALAALGAVLLAFLLPPAAPADKKADRKKEAAAVEALPEKYRAWLAEVEVLISDDEREAFLALTKDYQRDAFIERFWRARDPYPDTARNEYRDRWEGRLSTVKASFPDLKDERARLMLINGEPADQRKVECSTLLWPTEIWFYAGSDRVQYEFFLVFVRRFGTGPYRLWRPVDGLSHLFQQASGAFGENVGALLGAIRNSCYRGDEVAAILGSLMAQGIFGYESVLQEATSRPESPQGEWITTFNAYSTDLPEGAQTLEGSLDLLFPGRRQSRTVVQGLLTVPVAEAEAVELADYRSYNFVLNGEVLAGDELFDTFRYKFDFPAEEMAGSESFPMAFQRSLRPGEYRLVVKLEDLNGGKFLRIDRPLSVPAVEGGAPPPPADPEAAALLAEANAALATGDVALDLVEPGGDLVTGMRRIDALVTGPGVTRVAFRLDGREVLVKTRAPWSVELDLGTLPRPRTLSAVAFDAQGGELASDEVLLNASTHRFAVRLTEPRPGERYEGSLTARAEVSTPEGRSIERVEVFLNEIRVATLFQPPWEQPIVLAGGDGIAYVQAMAYLPDGNSTQDLVFVNAPDVVDALSIEFVELYTTVLDRQGRPVLGLAQGDFAVFEDGTSQEVRRFERVSDLPIHAVVLLDVSASMEESLGTARDAALEFLQETLTPKDRAAVVAFNDRPELRVKLTSDLKALAGGLAGLKAERGTALYDSLIFALHYFNGITGQRAVLVLSDGKDESSRFRAEDALEYARRAGVTIYSIGLALPKGEARRRLDQFAGETGGRSFFIESAGELPGIYAAIEEELRSQYLLAYQSSNTRGGDQFRTVEVKLGRSGLDAKTIRGYYP